MLKHRRILKFISLIILLVFAHEQIGWVQEGKPVWATLSDLEQAGSHHSLSEIDIAYDLGSVSDADLNGEENVIINVQDAHASLSAQHSISNILDSLVRNYDIKLIALEGSEGHIDTSILKTFPNKRARNNTAEFLMKEGKLSAGEFFAVTRDDVDITVCGVEESELYQKNLDSFREVMAERAENIAQVEAFEKQLKALSKKVYSSELKDLVKHSKLHRDGDISFSDYWEVLTGLAIDTGVDVKKLENVSKLLMAIEIEKEIDFFSANSERKQLIDILSGVMEKQDLEAVVLKSLLFKQGKISPAAFHTYLGRVAVSYGIDIKGYENLISYTKYISIYQSMDILGLYREFEELELEIRKRLYRNNDEKALFEWTRISVLLEKLHSIELSNREAELLLSKRDECRASDCSRFIKDMCAKYEIAILGGYDLGKIFSEIDGALEFYRVAEERNSAMIKNTLVNMKKEGTRVAALVTGGFHSKGLTDLMRENKLSYLVIAPKFEDGEERPYIAVLTNKKKPYQKLIDTGKYQIAVSSYFRHMDERKFLETAMYAFASDLYEGAQWKTTADIWRRNYINEYNRLKAESIDKVDGSLSLEEFDEIIKQMDIRRLSNGTILIEKTTSGESVYFLLTPDDDGVLGSPRVLPFSRGAKRMREARGEPVKEIDLSKEIKVIPEYDEAGLILRLRSDDLLLNEVIAQFKGAKKIDEDRVVRTLKAKTGITIASALKRSAKLNEAIEDFTLQVRDTVIRKPARIDAEVPEREGELTRLKEEISGKKFLQEEERDFKEPTWRGKLFSSILSFIILTAIVFMAIPAVAGTGEEARAGGSKGTVAAEKGLSSAERRSAVSGQRSLGGISDELKKYIDREFGKELVGHKVAHDKWRKSKRDRQKYFSGFFEEKEARARFDKINKWVNLNWVRIEPSLTKYMIEGRGGQVRPITQKKALFLVRALAPDVYMALEGRRAAIKTSRLIPAVGSCEGSRGSGAYGVPIVKVTKDFGNNYAGIAETIVHEGAHVMQLPESLMGLYLSRSFSLGFLEFFGTGMPASEVEAYTRETEFLRRMVNVSPEGGKDYFGADAGFSIRYMGQKNMNAFVAAAVWLMNMTALMMTWLAAGHFVKRKKLRKAFAAKVKELREDRLIIVGEEDKPIPVNVVLEKIAVNIEKGIWKDYAQKNAYDELKQLLSDRKIEIGSRKRVLRSLARGFIGADKRRDEQDVSAINEKLSIIYDDMKEIPKGLLDVEGMLNARKYFGKTNGEWDFRRGNGVALIAGYGFEGEINTELSKLYKALRGLEPDLEKLYLTDTDSIHVTIAGLLENTEEIEYSEEIDASRELMFRQMRDITSKYGPIKIKFYYKDLAITAKGEIVALGYVDNEELFAMRGEFDDRGISFRKTGIVHATIGRVFDENMSAPRFERLKAYVEGIRAVKDAFGDPLPIGEIEVDRLDIWDQRGATKTLRFRKTHIPIKLYANRFIGWIVRWYRKIIGSDEKEKKRLLQAGLNEDWGNSNHAVMLFKMGISEKLRGDIVSYLENKGFDVVRVGKSKGNVGMDRVLARWGKKSGLEFGVKSVAKDGIDSDEAFAAMENNDGNRFMEWFHRVEKEHGQKPSVKELKYSIDCLNRGIEPVIVRYRGPRSRLVKDFGGEDEFSSEEWETEPFQDIFKKVVVGATHAFKAGSKTLRGALIKPALTKTGEMKDLYKLGLEMVPEDLIGLIANGVHCPKKEELFAEIDDYLADSSSFEVFMFEEVPDMYNAVIEDAQVFDAPEISALSKTMTESGGRSISVERLKRDIGGESDTPEEKYYIKVCRVHGKIVGYAFVIESVEDGRITSAHIDQVAINRDFRRRNIARALIAAVINTGLVKEYRNFSFEALNSLMERVAAPLGFQREGVGRHFFLNDVQSHVHGIRVGIPTNILEEVHKRFENRFELEKYEQYLNSNKAALKALIDTYGRSVDGVEVTEEVLLAGLEKGIASVAPKRTATILPIKEILESVGLPEMPLKEYALKVAPWVEEILFYLVPAAIGQHFFGIGSFMTVGLIAAVRGVFLYLHKRSLLDMSNDEILGLFNERYGELKKHVTADWNYAQEIARAVGVEEGSRLWEMLRVISIAHDIGGVLGYKKDEDIETSLLVLAKEHGVEYYGMKPTTILKDFKAKGVNLTREQKDSIDILDHASNSIRVLKKKGIYVPKEVERLISKHMEVPTEEELKDWSETEKLLFAIFSIADVFEFGNNYEKKADGYYETAGRFEDPVDTIAFIKNKKFAGVKSFTPVIDVVEKLVEGGGLAGAVQYSRTPFEDTDISEKILPRAPPWYELYSIPIIVAFIGAVIPVLPVVSFLSFAPEVFLAVSTVFMISVHLMSNFIAVKKGALPAGLEGPEHKNVEKEAQAVDELYGLRETRKRRTSASMVIGVPDTVYDRMKAEDISRISNISSVSIVIRLKSDIGRDESDKKAYMLDKLEERRKQEGAIASAMVDLDPASAERLPDVVDNLVREMKEKVFIMTDPRRKNIIDPDSGQLNTEVVEELGSLSALVKEIGKWYIDDIASLQLAQISAYQLRVRDVYDSIDEGRRVVYSSEELRNDEKKYVIHYADGDDIFSERDTAIIPVGLEIARRREDMVVTKDKDTIEDKLMVVAPSWLKTEEELEQFKNKLINVWMLEGVVDAEDIHILPRKDYSTGELYGYLEDSTSESIEKVSQVGVRVIAGKLDYNDDQLLQLEVNPEAASNVNQYEVIVKMLLSTDSAISMHIPGITKSGDGRLYLYLPKAEVINLNAEIKEYERYVRKVYIMA